MSAKLARYAFRRIRGRIVPIRIGLEVAAPAVNKAAEGVVQAGKYRHKIQGLKKLGRGVDFNVFKIPASDLVMKLPGSNPSRVIKSKKLLEAIPNLDDKVARSQAIGENLSNFGIPTVETFSVRISKKLKALVQPFVKTAWGESKAYPGLMSSKGIFNARREVDQLGVKTGLGLDGHYGNLNTRGQLIDTALGKLPSYKSITERRAVREPFKGGGLLGHSDPSMAKEILDGGWIGRAPKDFKKADFITERAAVEGSSAKIMRAVRALKKKGYRLRLDENNAFKLTSPAERINRARAKGIIFENKGGRLVPRRGAWDKK
jgi:hypothetical protein